MLDDINTPLALAELHRLRAEAARGDVAAARALKAGGAFLGLIMRTAEDWHHWTPDAVDLDEASIEAAIVARKDARAAKDFAEARPHSRRPGC